MSKTTTPESATPAPEAPTNIIPLPVEAVEAPLECSPIVESQQPASDVSETPAALLTENQKPQTMQELIDSIDITKVTEEQIISEVMAGIQHLATSAAIGYGILSRIKIAEIAANAEGEANA